MMGAPKLEVDPRAIAHQIYDTYVQPTPPPVSAQTVNRYRLGAAIALLIMLGIGSSLWLNRVHGKGMLLPNALDPTPSPLPTPPLDATVAARNDALLQALQEVGKQQDAIDAARRDFLLNQATQEMQKNGTPLQVWLIRRLNAQVLQLRRAVGKGGEFSGSPPHSAIARSLIGDSKATLLALQAVLQDPSASPERHRVAPALLTKAMSELAELTRVVRDADYEQQLRNEERSRGKRHGTLPVH